MHNRYIANAEEKLEAAEYLLQGGFYNDAATDVLFVGVMLVLLAAMLRTAYEGVGWRWVTRSMPAITR